MNKEPPRLAMHPSPRRASPLPPSLRSAGNSPSLGVPFPQSGPTTLKELLNERSRHSPLAPPSPAMSNTSTDCFDSPESLHSSTFHFTAHHQTPDLNEMPTTMPLTPQSLNGDFRPYASQTSSLSASGPRNNAEERLAPNFQDAVEDEGYGQPRPATGRTRAASPEEFTVFDGTGPSEAVLALADSNQLQGAETSDLDSRARMISMLGPKLKINSPAPWDLDDSVAKAAPLQNESQPLAATTARRMSTSSTRRQGAKSSSSSSKENVRPSSATKTSSRTRSFSILSARRSAAPAVSPEHQGASEDALRGLGLGVGLGLGPESLSLASPSAAKSSAAKKASASRPDANYAGHSFPLSDPITPGEQSPSTASSGSRRSTRLPSGFDLISTPVPIEFTPPSSKLPASGTFIPAGASTGSTMSAKDGASSSGQGYKLISLEEARARENVRVVNAAAHRKAMLPVEHIANKDEAPQRIPFPSSSSIVSPSKERERQISSSTNSTVASSTGVLASNNSLSSIATHSSNPALSAKPTLKTKKSGFLKRMIQGSDKTTPVPTPPQQTSPVKEEEGKKSFRALPDDYVYDPSQPIPGSAVAPPVTVAPVSSPAPAPAAMPAPIRSAALSPKGKVNFSPALSPPADQRTLSKKGSAPELSLRPISMAFSAGLPTSFLANGPKSLSPTIQAPIDTGSSNSFTRAPLLTPPAATELPRSSSSGSGALPSPSVSPYFPSTSGEQEEAFLVLQDQFWGAKRVWMKKQADLEAQIRTLRAELEEMKACHPNEEEGFESAAKPCAHCGCAVQARSSSSLGASVLTRPRPVPQNTATGSLFGSGLAMAV